MLPETRCPVCRGSALQLVVRRENVPVHQNLIFTCERAALAAERGDLVLYACRGCGFVFNSAFDAHKLSYGPEYDNCQLLSGAFQEYVQGLVEHLLDERQIRGQRLVEVGCGRGDFLRALVAPEGANNVGVGFDPSYQGPAEDLDGRLRFERRFYDETCTDVEADVVISRHVIEHVPDPLAFLQTIAAALRDQPRARLFLETPCAEWILRNDVVWDVFYEHCSLFTAESLTSACARAGFAVQSIDHLFGGQYLWLEASRNAQVEARPDDGQRLARLAAEFEERQRSLHAFWVRRVEELARTRTLAVWGAGAKGSTFANLVDAERRFLACVVDINPAKQGGYIAGTGHPIVAPDDLAERGVSSALVLNPNYQDEVETMLATRGLPIEVLALGSR